MSSANPTSEQLALYIAFPISLFVLIALCVCYCYCARKLCFKQKDEALLSTDKIRFTVDLRKKNRRDSVSRSDSNLVKSPASNKPRKGRRAKPEEFVVSSIANPSFTHSAPVGQATSLTQQKKGDQTCDNLLSPRVSGAKTNDGLKTPCSYGVISSPTLVLTSEQSRHYPELRSPAANSEASLSSPVFQFHPTRHATETSLRPLSPGLSKRTVSEPATGLLIDFDKIPSQRKCSDSSSPHRKTSYPTSPKSLRSSRSSLDPFTDQLTNITETQHGLLPHRLSSSAGLTFEAREMDDSSFFPLRTPSPVHGSASRDQINAALTTATTRRRSSMQIPIDRSQIDPRLYQFATDRLPSVDLDSNVEGPKVHFSLNYNEELEVLTVKVIKAYCLPEADTNDGLADPYVTLTLKPGGDPHRSKVHRKTNDPDFGEEFVFCVNRDHLKEKILVIDAFNYDQFSRHECTGTISVELKEIDFEMMESLELWKPFKAPEESERLQPFEKFGDLLLDLTYLPSAEKLTVTVQRARNLRSPDTKNTLPDSYVKVCIYKGKQRLKKKKTSVVQAANNPSYNQAVTFNVPSETMQSSDVRLVCYVIHDVKLVPNVDLGYVEFGPECSDKEEQIHWKEMLSPSLSKPIARWRHLKAPVVSESSDIVPAPFRRKSIGVAQMEKLQSDANTTPENRRSLT